MKTRYEESFLFPNSQLDFKRSGLRGLDAVAPGYWEAFPDTKRGFEDALAFHQQNLIALQQALANPGPYDSPAYIQSLIQDAQTQIAYNQEQLRVDTSLPNYGESSKKIVEDINAKAEAAATAAAQAAAQQQAADVFAQAGAEEARQRAQQQADALAAQAAAQKAAADAAMASATANLATQTFTDAGLDAAAKQAAAARQAAAAAAAASKKITILALDADANGVYLGAKYSDGSDAVLARGAAAIDAWFKANGYTSNNAQKSSAYNKAIATTQTTATDTSSGVVQTKDTSSGTTTTANGSTGVITQTNATGQTVTGTGRIVLDGVVTTVDQITGTVTTENTRTGVVTQTDSSTGKTVTAVQVSGGSNTGGTFMFPDTGKTVTTTTPITGGSDAGKLALIGLLGVLLLRGAVR